MERISTTGTNLEVGKRKDEKTERKETERQGERQGEREAFWINDWQRLATLQREVEKEREKRQRAEVTQQGLAKV